MSKGEISIFKIQFENSDANFYMRDEIATQYLTEELKEQMLDTSCIYVKFTVNEILRDIKDISSVELKNLKDTPLKYMNSRLEYGKICKLHASIPLKEKSYSDAMKLYRKGAGAVKMISKDIVKIARGEVSSNTTEETELEDIVAELNQVKTQLMLNQGFIHWKLKEWEKMKKVNQEVFML
mmetsp:Transcript_23372/g.20766  ORF Transcript_23372/g.20766 Transcript_23372/m.20766 type:complete len:181 (+) Transcript_23372:410-952(+)